MPNVILNDARSLLAVLVGTRLMQVFRGIFFDLIDVYLVWNEYIATYPPVALNALDALNVQTEATIHVEVTTRRGQTTTGYNTLLEVDASRLVMWIKTQVTRMQRRIPLVACKLLKEQVIWILLLQVQHGVLISGRGTGVGLLHDIKLLDFVEQLTELIV